MIPRHIGIIPDGNRRFAKRLMLEPWKGHEFGAKKLYDLLAWCKEAGIKELTLWGFSAENFNRPKQELDYLIGIFKDESQRMLADPEIKEKGVRVRFIGRTEMFDAQLQGLIAQLEEATRDNSTFFLNIAIAYGGKQEIVDAAKKAVANGIQELNEQTFAKYLYLPSDLDLIIRTGGEKRLSNFLLFQAAYAELMFVDKMWPEFGKEDFFGCLEEFEQRERRFGK